MVVNKEIKTLEKSAVELTVTVSREEAKKEYNALVEKYAKTVHLKGFRKGKVPVSVLENKYGESLKAEASMKIMETSLQEVFEEIDKKPLPYVIPELKEESDLDFDKDFTFTVTYDTYPEVSLGEYKGLEAEEPEVEITDEDIAKELEAIREQNATVMEKAEGAAEMGDIVTINYWELDSQNEEIENSRREDFVFTIGSGYNIHKIDDEILGMKKGEEKVITKQYPEDYEMDFLRGKTVTLKVQLTVIKEKKLPELDDELAQDVSEQYKTLENLKEDLRKKFRESAENKVRGNTINTLLEKIAENTKAEIPKAMLDSQLESSWKSFVSQTRLPEEKILEILSAENKTKDSLFEEWTPEAEKRVLQQLIVNSIIEAEKIEATEEEYEQEVQKQAEASSISAEEVRDYFEKNSMVPYINSSIAEKKLFDFLLAQSKIKKGDKVKFLDLFGKKQ